MRADFRMMKSPMPGSRATRRVCTATGLILCMFFSIVAGAQNVVQPPPILAQSPLVQRTVDVPANVMLMLDNSSSMLEIVHDDAYDSNVDYQHLWIIGGSNPSSPPQAYSIESLQLTTPSGICLADYLKGTDDLNNPTFTKCLKLPDPVNSTTDPTVDTRYTPNYLHYLFQTYTPNDGDMADLTDLTLYPDFPQLHRWGVLKQVVRDRFASSEPDRPRWCLSTLEQYDPASPAPLSVAACGPTQTNQANLDTFLDDVLIEDIASIRGTPLAETYYKITEYFRGLSGHTSPVQYRCQANSVIIITDGAPTGDFAAPSDYPPNETRTNHGLSGTESLPDWDGLPQQPQPIDEQLQEFDFEAGMVPRWSDGFLSNTPISNTPFCMQNRTEPLCNRGGLYTYNSSAETEGLTLYLDDLALFGYEVDMFRTNTGTDAAGEPWGIATDPDDPSRFPLQNIRTHTIGFGIQNQMLEDTAEYGRGLSLSANSASHLESVLNEVLIDIAGLIGSASASTATTSFLSSGEQIFQARYETSGWVGSLVSHEIDSDPSSSTFGQTIGELWNTDTSFKSTSGVPTRNMLTVNDSSGTATVLDWNNLSGNQQQLLGNDSSRLDYLMGDNSQEQQNGGNFRDRSKLLGDVVHSSPVFVAALDYGYQDQSYQTWRESALIKNRDPVVYIGSNDGFLHGFKAPPDNTGGTEALAFLPASMYPRLNDLPEPNYEHHYFVDGSPVVIDSQLEIMSTLEWRSVLLAGFGAGAEGMFALDVTDPSKFANLSTYGSEVFLWEINSQFPDTGGLWPVAGNLAPTGTATQSSTVPGHDVMNAVDGNISISNFSRTGNDSGAWLELELDKLSHINQINIHNPANMLADFYVFVSPVPFVSQDFTLTRNQAQVNEFYIPGSAGTPTTIEVGSVGKYIRIQLGRQDHLVVGELEVIGTEDPEFPWLGHLLDRPSIVRVKDDMGDTIWYAITGNGVHSAGGNAVFYQVGLTDGRLAPAPPNVTGEIILDDSGDNGIVSHTAIDSDGDDHVDRVYLTDLKGNIWRMDWNPKTELFENYYTDSSSNPTPFFSATVTNTSTSQPLSVAMEVTRFAGSTDTLMLHIGTGKYYDEADGRAQTNAPEQSFYGIIDRGDASPFTTLTKSNLVEQTITEHTVSGNRVRTVSRNAIDYTTMSGWFIDLPTNGERVVFEPVALADKILFTTLIPLVMTNDPCKPLTSGWLMQVDAHTGGSPDIGVFDINNDGNFDDSDLITIGSDKYAAAGIQPSASGAPLPPSIIRVDPGDGSKGGLRAILSDTSGGLQDFSYNSEDSSVRTSWNRLD